jgi:hypothetical protein
MICPKCRSNSIPFIKTWLQGDFGRYRCADCGADCRSRESVPLITMSCCLGGLAVGLGALFGSWLVFAAAVAVTIVVDGLVEAQFRRLEPAECRDGVRRKDQWWLPWHWTKSEWCVAVLCGVIAAGLMWFAARELIWRNLDAVMRWMS